MKFALLSIALVLAAGCAPAAPDIAVSDAWARATAAGQSSAAVYATIANRGGADRLVEVSSEAGTAMLHGSETAGGIVRMRMLSDLAIPADAKVELAPGGTHVMLTGVGAPLAAGRSFAMTFRFARTAPRTVRVAIVAAGAR